VGIFRNMIRFYGEELLAPCPSPKQEGHPASAVHDCLFSIVAATFHIGGCSSILNLRTHRALVTDPLMTVTFHILKNSGKKPVHKKPCL